MAVWDHIAQSGVIDCYVAHMFGEVEVASVVAVEGGRGKLGLAGTVRVEAL